MFRFRKLNGNLFVALIIVIFGFPYLSSSQNLEELNFIHSGISVKDKDKIHVEINNKYKYYNEAEFLFLALIRSYQIFISSQQTEGVCVFHPSCSHFGQSAIKEFGVFKGILLTSDRLQRCNNMSMEYYEKKKDDNKLLDPVCNYKFRDDH